MPVNLDACPSSCRTLACRKRACPSTTAYFCLFAACPLVYCRSLTSDFLSVTPFCLKLVCLRLLDAFSPKAVSPFLFSVFILSACLLLSPAVKCLFIFLSVWIPDFFFFDIFFGGLECVGHSFAYVAHLWFLRDVWIRTQSAAVGSWRATDLATHPSEFLNFLSSGYLSTICTFSSGACIFSACQ